MKSSPSILSILLNIPVKELENIIYYGSKRVVEKIWLITDPKDSDMFDYVICFITPNMKFLKKNGL
nr:hypothetical protein [Marinitoga lauensis]